METINITVDVDMIDFDIARKSADEISLKILKEPFLVAWYDGIGGIGHPDVHECTSKPGWQMYGENRGGKEDQEDLPAFGDRAAEPRMIVHETC